MRCPRQGCGETITLTLGGKVATHKLPDGYRVCAASGRSVKDASNMEPPKK